MVNVASGSGASSEAAPWLNPGSLDWGAPEPWSQPDPSLPDRSGRRARSHTARGPHTQPGPTGACCHRRSPPRSLDGHRAPAAGQGHRAAPGWDLDRAGSGCALDTGQLSRREKSWVRRCHFCRCLLHFPTPGYEILGSVPQTCCLSLLGPGLPTLHVPPVSPMGSSVLAVD